MAQIVWGGGPDKVAEPRMRGLELRELSSWKGSGRAGPEIFCSW